MCMERVFQLHQSRMPVNRAVGRQKALVHDLPENVSLGENIVLQLVLDFIREPGCTPVRTTLVVVLPQRPYLSGIDRIEIGVAADLVCQHVGLYQVKRRRQDVGNQILALDDRLVDRSVHLELLDRIGLKTDGHEEAGADDQPEQQQGAGKIDFHLGSPHLIEDWHSNLNKLCT